MATQNTSFGTKKLILDFKTYAAYSGYQHSRIQIFFPLRRYFNLSDQVDRILFALESYNRREEYDIDKFSRIQAFKQSVANHRIQVVYDLESRTDDLGIH